MLVNDIRIYLAEFDRLLMVDGRVFFTAFVEEDVQEVSVNPSGYRRSWRGPLHCVRYERRFLEGLATEAGLQVSHFDYATESDGQSGIYLSRRT